MAKTVHFFIEIIFWIATFLSPVLLSGVIALVLYAALDAGFTLILVTLIIGVIVGVLFAERIRRKHGCANYWGRILATPDIWPIDDEKQKSGDVK